MSGTDELFPDATPLPAVAPVATHRRRGLGAAAFVLGLLAILGDLIGVTVALFTLLGAVTNLGQTFTNIDSSLGALFGVIVLEFLVFFGGILFAVLAVILGIVAAARNRGRVLGIFGVIFGVAVLLTHVALGITIATSGNVPGVTN